MLFFNLLSLTFAVFAQYDAPKRKEVFVQSTTLANCLLLVADQYPDAKVRLPSETYLKSFKGRHCFSIDDNSRVWMQYLGLNEHRNCDFATGHEESLKSWLLNQPDHSVDPVEMFKQAMDETNGNLLNSLITIHQMLRNNARWYSTLYYDYQSTPEDSRRFWNKLIDIRGDLRERGEPFEGDHAGSWYRFWGMALWRTKEGFNSQSLPFRVLTNATAYSMAFGAEAMKPLFVLFKTTYTPQLKDLRGKIKMNTLGVDLGAEMASYLADGALNLKPDARKKFFEKVCAEGRYL